MTNTEHMEFRRDMRAEIDRLRAELVVVVRDREIYNGYHQTAVMEIDRLRAALDKIIGIALGRAEFPAAMVHKIAMEALGCQARDQR